MILGLLALGLALIGWGMLCGTVLYEHVVVFPVWTRHPFESREVWRGPYRARPERLWPKLHPTLTLVLIAALIANWSTPAVAWRIGITLAAYVVIQIVTMRWFVPELMRLIFRPEEVPDAQLPARTRRWERLSQVRGLVAFGLAFVLIDAVRAVG